MPTMKVRLLSVALLVVAPSACTRGLGEVALRQDGSPGPEPCPAKALEVMRYVKLHVGDAAWVELDANQVGARPIMLYEGPIESILQGDFGTLEATTRLYGRVWTSGPQAVIRYYEAHPPGGDKLPICAVARLGDGQMRKRPESPPGIAILDYSVASAYVVESFR